MNGNAPSLRLRTAFEAVTIGAFLVLLLLPALDACCGLDRAPVPPENRRPASWPHFAGWGQSRAFLSGIEAYFNDHFGFRKQLVHWNNHWKGQLFTDASRHDILIGRDGWLYFSGSHMFEHWNRQENWSEADLSHWQRWLELRRDWLRARGIHYLFVVPPDKQNVYPEYMPEWLPSCDKPSKMEQLTHYLQARSTVAVLDLRPALLAARQLRPDYLKTDTHWNLYGGFVGSREIVRVLGQECPGLQPLPLDTYDWRSVAQGAGDSALMLGETERYPETQAVEPVPTRPLPRLEVSEPSDLSQRGAKRGWLCTTRNPQAPGKALVFGDSFSKALRPFLGQYFGQVLYFAHTDASHALIEREKPDVVIDEIVERGFNLRDPVELARQEQAAP